ncbi:MAG: helix-turn-helix domain-containing protein [Halovenus sp.]
MGESDTTRTGGTGVLSLLADSESRAILEATAATPMSVPELVDQCEIPTSTAYRKVETLVEAGLLDERTRIEPERRNPSEYLLQGGTVTVTADGAGQLRINHQVDDGDRAEDRSDVGDEVSTPRRLSTDGGRDLGGDTDARQRRLHELFVDVTGVEELVDDQETAPAKRSVDTDTESITETVTAVAQDDGLTDTIEKPDTSGTY